MRKSLLCWIVGISVLLAPMRPEPAAYAQRRVSGGSSHSSSGRSYSSGSSNSSRTSSSSRGTPSQSTKTAFPSRPSNPTVTRTSPSGKSYSSGSKSAPVGSSSKTPVKTASSPSEKKTTAPPRQDFPANTRPRSANFDEAAAAAQKKEQSRIAYSSRSPNASPSPGPASSPSIVHPSGKTYAKNGYDSAAAQAQRREESRVAYEAGTAPKPSYRTPGGIDRPIAPNAPQVQHVRRVVTPEVWRTRPARIGYVYGPYFGMPVVVYNDPYNSFFWYWLLSQSLDSQASWTYHHRYAMDQARYNDLLNRNAELATRVNQLEQSKLPRDTSFTPPGIDPDLVYADDYLDAAYNPQEVESDAPSWPEIGYSPPAPSSNTRLKNAWKALWHGVFAIAATAAICFLLIWLIFIKRWGGDRLPPALYQPRRGSRR